MVGRSVSVLHTCWKPRIPHADSRLPTTSEVEVDDRQKLLKSPYNNVKITNVEIANRMSFQPTLHEPLHFRRMMVRCPSLVPLVIDPFKTPSSQQAIAHFGGHDSKSHHQSLKERSFRYNLPMLVPSSHHHHLSTATNYKIKTSSTPNLTTAPSLHLSSPTPVLIHVSVIKTPR